MDLTGRESPMDVGVGQELPDDFDLLAGSPSPGGNYVPALPPIEGFMPPASPTVAPTVADLEIFGEFEFHGELDDAISRHMIAFRTVFCTWFKNKNYTSTLITKDRYNKLCDFCERITARVDCADLVREGYTQAYKWEKKYDMFSVGNSCILVHKPKEGAYDLAALPQPSYLERLFSDLHTIHYADHCKGATFYQRANVKHGNIPREVTKLFSDVCPHCISLSTRKKPVAGIRNIITEGFGQRGQVDLIDFQSMPDGNFKFLLNYIDHGIKFLISIPIVAKRASCIAQVLLFIFTLIGPPKILQSDNGGEFEQSAMDYRSKCLYLNDQEMDMIISEIGILWTECKLVRGSPRHSESNGGVERVNRTVQTKLGAWMATNKSNHWTIGCRLVQWRYNTQYHSTIKTTPYELLCGMKPLVGLSTLPIAADMLATISTETQLNDVFDNMNATILLPSEESVSLTEAGQSVVDDVRSNIEKSRKKKRQPTNDELQTIRTNKRSFDNAMAKAILPSSESPEKPVGRSPDVATPIGRKSGGDDDYEDEWTQLFHKRNHAVTLEEMQKSSFDGGKALFPIIYCTNNKDISNLDVWEPAILRKIGRSSYEVLDRTLTDRVESDDLEWEGDDGLLYNWNMYYKYPSEQWLCRVRTSSKNQMDDEVVEVSPVRKSLRHNATVNLQNRADKVRERALSKSPTASFKAGDVCLVRLDDVDRTKVDGGNLVGVIVEINSDKSVAKVATKYGLLSRSYAYHKLQPVNEKANNRITNDLEDAFENWRSIPKITEREAARFVSSVGGQGVIKCNCKGNCLANNCACKKAGRVCSSRCHRNSKCCKNMVE